MLQLSAGAIGLFDSGLGGLTVLRALKRSIPERQYLYLGDNARFPYGTKGPETIVRYSHECASFLLSAGVQAIVVACNTASATAIEMLQRECAVPVIGTIDPAVKAALQLSTGKRIGILGTNATCASGVYERALKRERSDVSVVSQPCPLFVPLVEAGMLGGDIVDKIVELYLSPLRDASIDTVILGCTHYPLLVEPIRHFLGEHVQIVECGDAIADEVRKLLGPKTDERPSLPDSFFVTDEVGTFNFLASKLLAGERVSAARIEHLGEGAHKSK